MKIRNIIVLMALVVSVAGHPLFAQTPAPTPLASDAPKPLKMLPEMARLFSEGFTKLHQSAKLTKKGDAFAQQGDWESAQDYYQQALEVYPTNQQALYGLVAYSRATSDTKKEIEYYRRAIYFGDPANGQFAENNTVKLMTYVLLLSQAGQRDEAVYVYNDTAKKMNDLEKVSNLGLLLPVFGVGPGQAAYTPARLQAMAHVALGVFSLYNEFLTDKEKLAHLQDAVRLAPDCADPYYHLGRHLERLNPAQSQAAFAKGARLDSLVPGAAARLAAGKPQ